MATDRGMSNAVAASSRVIQPAPSSEAVQLAAHGLAEGGDGGDTLLELGVHQTSLKHKLLDARRILF